MKYLIMFLVLTGLTFAQTTGVIKGGVTVWTDSIGYTNLDETSDSVWILDTKHYNWFKIFVDGNANSTVDSFYVHSGSFVYASAIDTVVDTTWGSWSPVQDSLFNSIHTMINNTVGKHFVLYDPVSNLLRFTLLNYRASTVPRNCRITVKAVKR